MRKRKRFTTSALVTKRTKKRRSIWFSSGAFRTMMYSLCVPTSISILLLVISWIHLAHDAYTMIDVVPIDTANWIGCCRSFRPPYSLGCLGTMSAVSRATNANNLYSIDTIPHSISPIVSCRDANPMSTHGLDAAMMWRRQLNRHHRMRSCAFVRHDEDVAYARRMRWWMVGRATHWNCSIWSLWLLRGDTKWHRRPAAPSGRPPCTNLKIQIRHVAPCPIAEFQQNALAIHRLLHLEIWASHSKWDFGWVPTLRYVLHDHCT